MAILLGWKWAPPDRDRDLYAVVDGFQAWDARPSAGELPWRQVAHFVASDVPAAGVERFDPTGLIKGCAARLGRDELEPGGRVAVTVITDADNAALAVQVELASPHTDALLPRLSSAFAEAGLVLYGPADDTLHSRGALDSAVLSAPTGHVWQPRWTDVTAALQQLSNAATIVYENERGAFVRLTGSKGNLIVDCQIAAGDGPTLARASRDGNERLSLDEAFGVFQTFFDAGERSPWFTWRPVRS